jgi:uncharacterized protein involved in exopolysaccharide biosynthesis
MADLNPNPGALMEDDEDSINLLDLLLVVAENIKLLIIGPLVVGLIALGYAFTITPTFTATTTIQPPPQGGQASTSAASASADGLRPVASINKSSIVTIPLMLLPVLRYSPGLSVE